MAKDRNPPEAVDQLAAETSSGKPLPEGARKQTLLDPATGERSEFHVVTIRQKQRRAK